ncbi:hypothetical protein C0991_010965 [Blastosporella zonata]|nr:hypothetical protein C0991_010965 [Blastosporella zonata]
MSLFFHPQPSHQLTVSFSADPDANLVSLGKNHWPTTNRSPIPVCIEPALRNKPSTIICWAQFDETVDGVIIPPKWKTIYPHIFPSARNTVSVVPTELVLLTEVVVMALSSSAYQVACTQESVLEDWLCKEHTIIRQGDVHTFTPEQLPLNGCGSTSSSVKYAYCLEMIEPVLQGFARKGATRFIVILADGLPSTSAEENVPECDLEEAIEIGEDFLANSALSPVFGQHDYTHENANGTLIETSEISFLAIPLIRQIDDEMDHCGLYVRTADLSKIGIQNGDWAMARPSSASHCRLLRILANDELVAKAPFGSRKPPVPNARTLTIARVASPVSISRIYQPLYLKSLKAYFDSTKRLVKQGDIIAVSIDTGDTIHHQENSESQETAVEDGPK